MANENGTLAKLLAIRNKFLTGFNEAAKAFDSEIRRLRESYLNELVDVALTDPRLSEVQRALGLKWDGSTVVTSNQMLEEQEAAAVEGTVPLPEKWPKKKLKTANCPACNTPVQDLSARFCSQCASPLFEFG